MSIAVSRLLPQWLRVGYSASALEVVRELEQKFHTLVDRLHHLFHKCNLDPMGGCGRTQLGPHSSAKLLSGGATTK